MLFSTAAQEVIRLLGAFILFGLGTHACLIVDGEITVVEEVHPVEELLVPADPQCAEYAASPLLKDELPDGHGPIDERELRWLKSDEFLWEHNTPIQHIAEQNAIIRDHGGVCVWLNSDPTIGDRVDGKPVLVAPEVEPIDIVVAPECASWAVAGNGAYDLDGEEIVWVKNIKRCVLANCAYADQYDDLGDPDNHCVLPTLRTHDNGS